jgi:response regulator RpfG family c-di-GMP phosphodiesterase
MTQRPAKLKALFVDDEPMILEGLSQLFDMTYDVYTACSGQEAIEYARQLPDLAIVVSDQRMPGLKGIDVLRAIKEISPDTIRILLTGFADADAILDSVNVGEVFRYVRKPWNPDELTALLSLAAATYLERKKVKVQSQAPASVPTPSEFPLRKDSFMTLLLTDQRMPKKTGTDFLIESREIAPLVPKILITAYTDVEDIIRLINEGQIYRYIQKPWDPEKLRATIREAIELYLYQVKSKLGEYEHAQPTADDHVAQHTGSSASTTNVLNALQALSQMVKQQSNSPNT